jgi:hypothetical protein
MSVEGRKAALERKHAEIEAELRSLAHHPSADPETEKNLKREKLKLKDELQRLGG